MRLYKFKLVLLQTGIDSIQAQKAGRMAKKSSTLLHMARLEENRKEKEKPNPFRNQPRYGLCLESH